MPVEAALVLLARCLFRDIKQKESKPAYYARGSLYFILTGSFLLLLLGKIVILASDFLGECMPQFDYIDSDDGYDEDGTTTCASESPAPVAATPETKTLGNCVYCLYPIEGKELQTCTECGGHACLECIRTLFLVATKNESCMPPRCCGKAIPLAVGRQVLTGTEVETFKEKHEEWNTARRCYCPVPRCSAFLPPSMFPELRASFSGERSSVISCPQFNAEVCTSCVQEEHPGRKCKDNSMTPELVRALEKIGAKQCPKCCAATEKDGACPSMRCCCGATWCWYCRRTVNLCILWPCETIKGQPTGIKDKSCFPWDDECLGDASVTDGDDIGTIPFPEFVDYSSEELEEEADAIRQDLDFSCIVPFDCLHEWRAVEHWEFNVELQFVCERCWGEVHPFASPSVRSSGGCNYSRVYKRPKVKEDLDLVGDSIMVACGECSLFVCNSCRKEVDAGQ